MTDQPNRPRRAEHRGGSGSGSTDADTAGIGAHGPGDGSMPAWTQRDSGQTDRPDDTWTQNGADEEDVLGPRT